MVGAHSTGTCQKMQSLYNVGYIISPLCVHHFYCATSALPTPPKGRATIRLCRTLSLEQKLPLEVSLISLEMTCIVTKSQSVIIGTDCTRLRLWILSRLWSHVPCCCWNMRRHREVSLAYWWRLWPHRRCLLTELEGLDQKYPVSWWDLVLLPLSKSLGL